MKKSILTSLAVAGAVGLIATAPSAMANIITVATATDDLQASSAGHADITVNSTVTQDTVTGKYTYSYALSDGGVDTMNTFSAYFNTGAPNAIIAGTIGGSDSYLVSSFDISWQWANDVLVSGQNVSFQSWLPPSHGSAAVLDNAAWGGSGFGLQVGYIDVPNIPDGGLTMAMVGCVFVGIAGIRYRLGKRA